MNTFTLDSGDARSWDDFVYRSRHTTVWHLAGWRQVLRQVFKLKPYYLYAEEDGEIRGVLPLWEIKSLFFGHYFTSMPGGLCAEDADTARALAEHAQQLADTKHASHLILRDGYQRWDLPEYVTRTDHCTLVVDLTETPDELWHAVRRQVRQSTKKAQRAGLAVRSGPQCMAPFYPVYARSMRDKGTPTQGEAFFQEIRRQFPDHFSALVVHNQPELAGGGYVAPFRETVYCTWGGMLPQYYDMKASYLLYWELLRDSCEQGFRRVDLGRSQWQSGTYQFKRQWNAEPRQLYQQFYLNRSQQPPPTGSQRQTSSSYRLLVRIWQHLPLTVAEFLGPRIRKAMPFG